MRTSRQGGVGTVPDWKHMPKNTNSARKNAARDYAAERGISYTAALRQLPPEPVFRDSDFRLPSRTDRYPSSQQMHVARGGSYVEIRNSALAGTPAHRNTAVRLTEDQFDQYQLSARAGHPDYSVLKLVTYDTVYTWSNAEDPDSNTLTSDQDAFVAFLDGVYRGDFGGPSEGTNDGLTSGGGIMLAEEQDDDLDTDQELALLVKAAEWVVTRQNSSFDALRDALGISFSRTALLLRALESFAVVGPHRGPADRDVLATPDDLDDQVTAIRSARGGCTLVMPTNVGGCQLAPALTRGPGRRGAQDHVLPRR